MKYIDVKRFILRKQSFFAISVKHKFYKTSTTETAGRLKKNYYHQYISGILEYYI